MKYEMNGELGENRVRVDKKEEMIVVGVRMGSGKEGGMMGEMKGEE